MVLISWDGAQMAHTLEMVERGELPNLRALRDGGGLVETTITTHGTETTASHAEMLTGYPPEVTGVYSLAQCQPIPRELTVLYRLKQHFGRQNITTVWVSSNSERISSEPGKPWHQARQDADVWNDAWHRPNWQTGRLCLDYLRAHARPNEAFFCFFHFREPDHSGHQHGENSPEYDAALIDTDKWLGRIRETLDELGVGASTAVLVATDHGFGEDQDHHKNAPDAWLATDWAPVEPGNQRDLAPTVLAAFGVELDQLTPPLPGQPLWAGPD
jgi:predicted AlkP superfamily pyrophosphatase or phosphodiesterase